MVLAFLIALVSAGTTITAGYWDYKTKVALKQENKVLNQNKIQLTKITEEQQQRLKQSESELVAAYETVELYKKKSEYYSKIAEQARKLNPAVAPEQQNGSPDAVAY